MVDLLVLDSYLKTPAVIKAFKNVDRAKFVPFEERTFAYSDTPLPIGSGQTISAPSMVAIMTEALGAKPGHTVLEIGAGSGYQAAILSKIIGEKGRVYTVERVKGLAGQAKKNLVGCKNVKVLLSDGTLGYKKAAPYDRIIVTAAAPKVPQSLVSQLKRGGALAIPVGSRDLQNFVLVKKNGKITEEYVCCCVFVPLIGEEGWQEKNKSQGGDK